MIKQIIVPMPYTEENVNEQIRFQKQKFEFQGIKNVSEKSFPTDNGKSFFLEFSVQEKAEVSRFIDLSEKVPNALVEVVFGEKGEEEGIEYVDVTAIFSNEGWSEEHYYRYYKKEDLSYKLDERIPASPLAMISDWKLSVLINESFSTKELDRIFDLKPCYYY